MALWNVAYQRWFFWDGRADSLWAQSLQPLHSEREMGASPEHILNVVSGDPALTIAYESLFGSVANIGTTGRPSLDRFVSNLGKTIEAYQRRIISTDAPFDRFVTGLRSSEPQVEHAISESAQRGLKLFAGRGQCVLCHAGPNLADGEFHNVGLPRRAGSPPDKGRFVGIRKLQEDRFNGLNEFSDDRSLGANIKLRYLIVKLTNLGEFKTPTLRNIAETAPYMHDGRFATLKEILDFYSELPGEPVYGHREETLKPLNFTEREKEDLVAFLESLTGAALDESLTRPAGNSQALSESSQ
jgi:cytochrome c peroxidase